MDLTNEASLTNYASNFAISLAFGAGYYIFNKISQLNDKKWNNTSNRKNSDHVSNDDRKEENSMSVSESNSNIINKVSNDYQEIIVYEDSNSIPWSSFSNIKDLNEFLEINLVDEKIIDSNNNENNGFQNNKEYSVLDILAESHNSYFSPTIETYNILLNYTIINKQFNEFEYITKEILDEEFSPVIPNKTTMNILLNGLGKKYVTIFYNDSLMRKFKELQELDFMECYDNELHYILTKFESLDIEIDLISQNTILSSLIDLKRNTDAWEQFDSMNKDILDSETIMLTSKIFNLENYDENNKEYNLSEKDYFNNLKIFLNEAFKYSNNKEHKSNSDTKRIDYDYIFNKTNIKINKDIEDLLEEASKVKIQKNPVNDDVQIIIKSFLLTHYFKHSNKNKASLLAKELLQIDSNNRLTLKKLDYYFILISISKDEEKYFLDFLKYLENNECILKDIESINRIISIFSLVINHYHNKSNYEQIISIYRALVSSNLINLNFPADCTLSLLDSLVNSYLSPKDKKEISQKLIDKILKRNRCNDTNSSTSTIDSDSHQEKSDLNKQQEKWLLVIMIKLDLYNNNKTELLANLNNLITQEFGFEYNIELDLNNSTNNNIENELIQILTKIAITSIRVNKINEVLDYSNTNNKNKEKNPNNIPYILESLNSIHSYYFNKNITHSLSTLSSLIQLYSLTNNPNSSIKLFDECIRKNYHVNSKTYERLINVQLSSNHVERAIALFKHMMNKKIEISCVQMFENLINISISSLREKEACEMLCYSLDNNYEIDFAFLNNIITILCKNDTHLNNKSRLFSCLNDYLYRNKLRLSREINNTIGSYCDRYGLTVSNCFIEKNNRKYSNYNQNSNNNTNINNNIGYYSYNQNNNFTNYAANVINKANIQNKTKISLYSIAEENKNTNNSNNNIDIENSTKFNRNEQKPVLMDLYNKNYYANANANNTNHTNQNTNNQNNRNANFSNFTPLIKNQINISNNYGNSNCYSRKQTNNNGNYSTSNYNTNSSTNFNNNANSGFDSSNYKTSNNRFNNFNNKYSGNQNKSIYG